jgi:Holliday junction DNA helicase RuvA
MLDYIKGKLISKSLTSATVESNGMGFLIKITLPAYDALPQTGEEVTIPTHLHVKENPMTLILYGFADEKERECFRNIISVSGVGPKTAVSMLSAIDYNRLNALIAKGDSQPLTGISGVGKKTAERIVVELRDRMLKPEMEIVSRGISKDGEPGKLSEIISALLSLGYSRNEAENMIKKVTTSPAWKERNVEEIIKEILRGK